GQPALLQRTGRGAARPPLRGDRPDAAGGVGQHVLADRRSRAADVLRRSPPGPGPGRSLPGAGQLLHPGARRHVPAAVRDGRPPRRPRRHRPRGAGHLLGPPPPVNVVLTGVRGTLTSPRPVTARYGGTT